MDVIERTFKREGSLYIACNDRNSFFTADAVRDFNLWFCQKMCETLTSLLDKTYIRFGSKLYRQIVGIAMGTNYIPLVANLFLFCYERDFLLSLSEDNQSDVIEAFNSTSRYLDDLLNIDNNFFDSMVDRKLVEAPPPPPPPPVNLLLAVPRRLFFFGSLVILDVVCRYLSLFLLYIK